MYSLPIPRADSLRAHPFVWLVALLSTIPFITIVSTGLENVAGWFAPQSLNDLWLSPWRILTPTFVHYTVGHVFTNIYIWWYFGAKIEERSRLELVVLFLLAALAGNIAQWYFSGPHFGGLSGVTYALLSYCWCITFFYKTNILNLDRALSILLLAFLPLSATGLFGKFSDAAHFTGLLCGAILAVGKYTLSNYTQRT
ncbi:Membrane associated serine protease, rhomboid family [Alteromonadaceae bacterium Bs31]|nr:Membrane associated serine protease, rhomboid family [Alteromonadaceae bacterium Bs31]